MVRNPWMTRRVLHFAHQGGAREAPSSTLFAMRQAIRNGADGIELDVHRTIDGILVVCHDSTVDRTTQGSGRICDLTLSELRNLDNAYWWVPGFESTTEAHANEYVLRGQYPENKALGIATLEEVLKEFTGTYLNFDIKDTAPEFAPYEHQLADMLREHGRIEDIIVASFHDSALASFRNYAPEIHTSMGPAEVVNVALDLADDKPLSALPSVVAMQLPVWFGSERVITSALIAAAHEADIAVHAWTIDEPAEIDELISLGIDGIITDCPTVLVEAFRRTGARSLTYPGDTPS
jgi:glycerophosphoryl diester phosphodiesterase